MGCCEGIFSAVSFVRKGLIGVDPIALGRATHQAFAGEDGKDGRVVQRG